jgi:hypothetical protein
MTRISTVAERRRLMKTLSRTSALLMKIRVRPDSDPVALADYWANGRRAKDVQALIESLTKVPGSASLDVAHLLPSFARKRLNTFPVPATDDTRPPLNCYWTSLNFFNDPPDDRYLDDPAWKEALDKNFTHAAEATLGDIMFLVRPNGLPVHAVVYIADDVVFTKNGYSDRQPWILMKWEDMIAGYPEREKLSVVIFHPLEETE